MHASSVLPRCELSTPDALALSARRLAPSPMALVRQFTSCSKSARAAAVYFDNDGVRGPKFGPRNEALLSALSAVQQELVREMAGMRFSVAMRPEYLLHASPEHRTEIVDAQRVPAFAQLFEPVFRFLAANPAIAHPCEVRLEVDTGRQFCDAVQPPRVTLVVIERVPKSAENTEGKPAGKRDVSGKGNGRGAGARPVYFQNLTSDPSLELGPGALWAQSILRWFAGSSAGFIQVDWQPDAQRQLLSR